jgi:hypothetical protein
MEKKPIRDCHKVCDGCELGKLKAKLTAESNTLRTAARQKLASQASHQKSELLALAEQSIARHGGDSYSGAKALRDNAALGARVVDTNLENFEEKNPEQEVVCGQDGPTKILRSCGAVAINRR